MGPSASVQIFLINSCLANSCNFGIPMGEGELRVFLLYHLGLFSFEDILDWQSKKMRKVGLKQMQAKALCFLSLSIHVAPNLPNTISLSHFKLPVYSSLVNSNMGP